MVGPKGRHGKAYIIGSNECVAQASRLNSARNLRSYRITVPIDLNVDLT
jgi:hypothetical protein